MSNARQVGLSISAETDKLVFGKSDTSHTEKGFYTNKNGQKLFTRYATGNWHQCPRFMASANNIVAIKIILLDPMV